MKVTIERLGLKGDGIAAGPVFVPRTLPGEEVEGDIDGDQIAAPRIVTPSPDRVSPPCRHYKSCGGCALQHASDAFVAEWKEAAVKFALTAQGLSAPMRPIATSPAQSRRRATLSARRTKKGALVGFHGRASDTLVEVPDCLLLDPALKAALLAIEALCLAGGSRRGEMKAQVALSTGGIDMAVSGGKPLDGPLRIELAGLATRFDLARLTWDGEQVVERRPAQQVFGTTRVTVPAGAFLQATPQGEAALVAAVTEAVGPARHVADLFAGCGTFALALADKAEVHAVEGAPDMLAALDQGWRRAQGLKRVTIEARDLFRRPLLPDELKRFDAVVIDPPRAGAEAQVAELARSDVRRIAAVSCNPVTFARDARVLVDSGFSLDWVQVVDQFRWSPHIELAAQFTKT